MIQILKQIHVSLNLFDSSRSDKCVVLGNKCPPPELTGTKTYLKNPILWPLLKYSFQKEKINSLFYISEKATFTEQTLINTAETLQARLSFVIVCDKHQSCLINFISDFKVVDSSLGTTLPMLVNYKPQVRDCKASTRTSQHIVPTRKVSKSSCLNGEQCVTMPTTFYRHSQSWTKTSPWSHLCITKS